MRLIRSPFIPFRRQIIIIGGNGKAKEIADQIIEYNAPFWVEGILGVSSSNGLQTSVRKDCIGKLDALPAIVSSKNIDEVIGNVENTLSDARKLINNTNGQVDPLVSDLRTLIKHFDDLAQNLNKQIDVVAGNLNQSLDEARGVVSEDAPLILQIEETLESVSSMTDSIRQLADYLGQNPESLLRGKGN